MFANLPHNEKFASEAMAKDEEEEDELLINVIEEGNAMLQNLQILNMQPQICLRDRDSAYKPINLYHKVGHGKLDMYVINPSKDAKEIREFMERWNGENSKSLGIVALTYPFTFCFFFTIQLFVYTSQQNPGFDFFERS